MKVLYKNNLRKSQSITVLIISKKKAIINLLFEKKRRIWRKNLLLFHVDILKLKKFLKRLNRKIIRDGGTKQSRGQIPECASYDPMKVHKQSNTHTTKNRTLSLALTNKLQKQKLDHENVVVLIVPYTRSTRVQHRYFFGSQIYIFIFYIFLYIFSFVSISSQEEQA